MIPTSRQQRQYQQAGSKGNNCKQEEAIAEAVFMSLVEHSLEGKVFGVTADTTATNFGRWSGAIRLLQVEMFNILIYRQMHSHFVQEMLGYPVVVIPCGHHVQELVPKHITRLLTGRATTGPGEVLFLKFYNSQNEISDLIRPDLQLKKFNWDDYAGTSVAEVATFVRGWSEHELRTGSFQRGDYR